MDLVSGVLAKPVVIRQFKDKIYDYIPIYPRTCAFIDTKQFQRLRHVKQLGTSYYVWPGASHNRFEHCLGVAFLARRMVEHLRDTQPELMITDREIECVELAGLCHDLGHGPLSHVWDNNFIPQALRGKKWKHEDASEMMFDDLVLKNDIDITEQDCKFIKALIAGDVSRCSNPPEKPFLFDIVANKRNGIDVDKFDYIVRDSDATGEGNFICMTRLIHSARVIDNQICYNIKDANTLFEMCHARYSLNKLIYTHKTACAIEYMFVDALLSAEPHLLLAEQIESPEKYIHLCDNIIQRIEMSEDPQLEEARTILSRVVTRDLYSCVDFKVLPWDYKGKITQYCTPESIVSAAKTYQPENERECQLVEELDAKHVIIDENLLHYGMGKENPLDKIKFYSKRHPNTCASAGPGDISSLVPPVFGEVLFRIYTRESRFIGIIQHGYRIVCQNLLKADITRPTDHSPVRSSTPEAPSTPKLRTTSDKSFTTPFSNNNSFTTVKFDYQPPSPTQDRKRGRNVDQFEISKKTKRSV